MHACNRRDLVSFEWKRTVVSEWVYPNEAESESDDSRQEEIRIRSLSWMTMLFFLPTPSWHDDSFNEIINMYHERWWRYDDGIREMMMRETRYLKNDTAWKWGREGRSHTHFLSLFVNEEVKLMSLMDSSSGSFICSLNSTFTSFSSSSKHTWYAQQPLLYKPTVVFFFLSQLTCFKDIVFLSLNSFCPRGIQWFYSEAVKERRSQTKKLLRAKLLKLLYDFVSICCSFGLRDSLPFLVFNH